MAWGDFLADERKKLYLYAGINFMLGIIMGVILFYGQIRNDPAVFATEYSYDRTIEIIDFLRIWWLDMMWLLAIFMAHGLVKVQWLHIILLLRGCASSYGTMYLLHYIGIKETISSVLPQCLSVFPLMMWFSVYVIHKRRKEREYMSEGLVVTRIEMLRMLLFSMVASAVETLIFALLGHCLF